MNITDIWATYDLLQQYIFVQMTVKVVKEMK